jgi:ABC-2 type transport system permease protein
VDKIFAFIRRDAQLAATAPLSFAYETGQTLAGLLSFYFIGKITTMDDYFRFVLFGMIGAWAMSTGLSAVQQTIHFERANGTLEAILLTRTPLATLFAGQLVTQLFRFFFKVAVCLMIGHWILGVQWNGAHWGMAAGALTLTLLFFLGGGLALTAASLVYRDTGPLEGFLGWALRFSGGVYFPVGLLPAPLQWTARWNPLTHGLDLIRSALAGGVVFSAVIQAFVVLAVAACASVMLGSVLLHWALTHARQNGRLGFPP